MFIPGETSHFSENFCVYSVTEFKEMGLWREITQRNYYSGIEEIWEREKKHVIEISILKKVCSQCLSASGWVSLPHPSGKKQKKLWDSNTDAYVSSNDSSNNRMRAQLAQKFEIQKVWRLSRRGNSPGMTLRR
jgi:hypothetical protein